MKSLERLLVLAEKLYEVGDLDGIKSLDTLLSSYIKKHAHMAPNNNGKTPNPWRHNMDYASWENSPYYGSVSEFMEKFPGGIKDWVAWRHKEQKDRFQKWDTKKRSSYAQVLMKYADHGDETDGMDFEDLTGPEDEYEPTKKDLEESQQDPTKEDRNRAERLLDKMLELGLITKEEVKDYMDAKALELSKSKGCEVCGDTRELQSEHGEWPSCPGCGTNADDKPAYRSIEDLSRSLHLLSNEGLLYIREKLDELMKEHKDILTPKEPEYYDQTPDDEFNFADDKKSDVGYVGSIEKETEKNKFFRKVIFTGKHAQLVLMSVNGGEELGSEVHTSVDQFFRIEEGVATFVLNGAKKRVKAGGAVLIPAGTEHNVINASKTEPLKLYTVYSPPNHPPGTIHKTKEDADKSEKEKHDADDKTVVAHYEPVGGDDVNKFSKEPHLYSGDMNEFKSVKEYIDKYHKHTGQDASDGAYNAVQDFIKYWKILLKTKNKRKAMRNKIDDQLDTMGLKIGDIVGIHGSDYVGKIKKFKESKGLVRAQLMMVYDRDERSDAPEWQDKLFVRHAWIPVDGLKIRSDGTNIHLLGLDPSEIANLNVINSTDILTPSDVGKGEE